MDNTKKFLVRKVTTIIEEGYVETSNFERTKDFVEIKDMAIDVAKREVKKDVTYERVQK